MRVFFGRRNTPLALTYILGNLYTNRKSNDAPTGHIPGIGFQNGNIIVTQVSNLKARSYIFWIEPKTGRNWIKIYSYNFFHKRNNSGRLSKMHRNEHRRTAYFQRIRSFYNPNFGHMFCLIYEFWTVLGEEPNRAKPWKSRLVFLRIKWQQLLSLVLFLINRCFMISLMALDSEG